MNRLISCSIVLLFLHLFQCNSIDEDINNNNKLTKSRHKSVNIGLYSNWKETPLYLEFAEFLAEENDEFIWVFIESLYNELGVDSIKSMSDRNQYEIMIELSRRILQSEAKLSILKYSLSLRSHSPSVAMFNQIANDLIIQENSLNDNLNDCEAFVELSKPSDSEISIQGFSRLNCQLSSVKTSFEALSNAVKNDGLIISNPVVYKMDHIFSGSQSSDQTITAILYGEIGTNSFHKLHQYLKQLAKSGSIKYVIRHYIKEMSNKKVSLSGYGVELAIKSTEYKAQDDTKVKGEVTSNNTLIHKESHKPDEIEGFVFSKLKESFPDKSEKLDEFQTHLLDSGKEIATLKVWELQEISLQATKKIMSSHKNDALRVLRDIAQNFPTEARSLIKISVDNDFKKEIEQNQQMFMQNLNLGTTDAALFINGLYYDIDTIDVFTLLNIIKKEFKLIEGLHRLVGGRDDRLKKLIKLDINNDKQDFQIDIRDGAVLYVNDIENDNIYRNWPSGLQDMLRPTYPGMLRNVRRNIYHLVLILDPSKKESHDILKLAESFYVHKAPVRIGLVFAVSSNMSVDGFQDAGVACLEAFNFISQDKTPYDGLSFLTDIIATVNSEGNQRDIKPGDVINQFKAKYKNEDLDMIFGSDSDYDTGRKLAWDFIHKTGIGQPIKALLNGVVLKETHLNAELFEEVVLTEIMKQTTAIQKAIYKGELTDSNDVLEWLMSQKSVMPRLNRLILNTDENSNSVINKYIDFNGEALDSGEVKDYQKLGLQDLHNTFAHSLKYIKTKSEKCNAVTLWFASNYETKVGRDMLLAAISHLRSNSLMMRLGVVYTTIGPVSKVIESSIFAIDNSNHLLHFLYKFLTAFDNLSSTEEPKDAFGIAIQLIQDEYKNKFKETYDQLNEESNVFKLHKAFCVRALSIGEKDSALVLNGRVIQIPFDEPFVEDDFSLIEKYAMTTFADKILSELSPEETNDPEKCSDLVLKISCVLLAKPQSKARHDIKYFDDKHSVLSLEPLKPEEPSLDFTAIFDPLTRGAQKITPILMTLHKVFNSNIKIFFNCVDKHSEMPLKSFYRFVIDTEPKFSVDDELILSKAHFSSMPTTPLLTLGMAVPDNWLVESTESIYDLDNIHLDQVDDNGVWADFELEHLLLEGHCFEQSSGNPPRGLQFTLGTNSTPVMVDTIVMANLGYFQLKANPGSWNLRLRQGRSVEIYNIISHEGTDSPPNSPDVVTLISSFRSNVIKIRVNKKIGKQNEELLYDSDEDDFDDANSIWNSFSWSSHSEKKKTDVSITDDVDANRINVFSLASGHLYERLLRIMMISVLKNTKTPVKFWFLKNYLSPSFKNVLPFMAKKHGFEYELVQYKWPRWLHQQSEKQRIIWGYKILFLDVLFPLDVKKIIFVDADQVVRADLKELRDLDLEGAPYGYTPFCDSRTDMDGFRFWKSGYWATHLHGRKYHISALYVVDLQKFRRIAAGDRLRGQYQGLSQDPNSLSNLDQDLPNNMIHQVSIKSLPQEWLWCETWCDDESKKKAKTIDLCNNPKTKEPKLTGARRILAEWEGYDNEIKAMLDEYERAKSDGSINQILSEKYDPNISKSDASKHESHIEL